MQGACTQGQATVGTPGIPCSGSRDQQLESGTPHVRVLSHWPLVVASVFTCIIKALVCSAFGDFQAERNFVLVTELVTRFGASNSSY